LLAVAVCFSLTSPAFADQLDDQIAALKQQANSQQATAAQFAAQANDYQARVNQLHAQIGALQADINLKNAQYNQVVAQIAANEANLADKKAVLGANLKSMYLDSSVTPIEMIASSNNLSDYFNQQQYQDSIKDKIQLAMADIVATQKQLAIQKTQVEAILAQLNGQKQQLAAAQAEANQLLAAASQSAASANAQVAASNSQINALKAQQAAILAAKYAASGSHFTSSGSCGGGYPSVANGRYGAWGCSQGKDVGVDNWAMYNRECVSYTAFKISVAGRGDPRGWGNANQWPSAAQANGVSVTSSPRAGDIAISMLGTYGHAMYVEGVSGGNIYVSQYNFGNNGEFSTMTIPASGLYFIHF
jgi:surface antigen